MYRDTKKADLKKKTGGHYLEIEDNGGRLYTRRQNRVANLTPESGKKMMKIESKTYINIQLLTS